MRKGFLIYEEMCKYLVIYEEAFSLIWLCNWSLVNFLIYEENFLFFLSVYSATYRPREATCYHWAINHLRTPTSSNQLTLCKPTTSCNQPHACERPTSCRQPNCALKPTSFGHPSCKIWQLFSTCPLQELAVCCNKPTVFHTIHPNLNLPHLEVKYI